MGAGGASRLGHARGRSGVTARPCCCCSRREQTQTARGNGSRDGRREKAGLVSAQDGKESTVDKTMRTILARKQRL